ncbi:MAG: aminoglycoside phosphotransferase family protein [Clostridiales bacterium]|nr:aminoglycoside phosphotransferase family protein [Clostridiales bacterium]
MDISQLCTDFCFKGDFICYDIIVAGNINSTYKVHTEDENGKHQYLLQKINKNVFKEPEKIMENIKNVNDYIDHRHKCEDLFVLHFKNSKQGFPYVIDEDGNFWRACKFFDCACFNSPSDLSVIEEAGRAFGQFQYLLDGYDAERLHVTIPDFHNTRKRIAKLEKTIKYAPDSRKSNALEEIQYILDNKNIGVKLCELLDEGKLPLRVTHNDTKCNNVLFNKDTLKALAVIDLDTVMPGLCAYDFGDGARSICSLTDEDEVELNKVGFDLERFDRFCKGYFKYLKDYLTQDEKDTLALSVYVMTLELASRFLQDYLNGDVYFRVAMKEHNLIRARCQIALCKDIKNKLEIMDEIIKKYL